MLPGFRFLFAAIVLSISTLIFGLGAAALLRAAHEEFAGIPSRRAPPETTFAQPSDAEPVLAMLRTEPSVADDKAIDPPITDQTQDQADINLAPTEAENPVTGEVAALDAATPPENSPTAEAAASEAAAPETPIETETAQTHDTASPTAEATVAAAELAPPAPAESATAEADQPSPPIEGSASIADSKIATLDGPPAVAKIRTPSNKRHTRSKMARAAVRKSPQPERVIKRRKTVPRVRLARPAPQWSANPFGGWENRAVQGTAPGRGE